MTFIAFLNNNYLFWNVFGEKIAIIFTLFSNVVNFSTHKVILEGD